jgi:hypothetical protein
MLIGIAGRAGVGKDTAARYLAGRYNLIILRLATPLKRMLQTGLGLSSAQVYGEAKDEAIAAWGGVTPRQLMCSLGAWGRFYSETLWLQRLEEAAYALYAPITEGSRFGGVVVSDVRLEIEAAWIRSRGGLVIHLTRDGPGSGSIDITEQNIMLGSNDRKIDNNGTVEALHRSLCYAVQIYRDRLP